MFNNLRMRLATKRLQRQKDFAAADKRIAKTETEERQTLMRPLRMLGRALRCIWDITCCTVAWIWASFIGLIKIVWKWLCGLNVIGLINLALLVAIIVLFSMLIINMLNYKKTPVIVVPKQRQPIVTQTVKPETPKPEVVKPIVAEQPAPKVAEEEPAPIEPRPEPVFIYPDDYLPVQRDQKGNMINGPKKILIEETIITPCGSIKTKNEEIYGDVIIENLREANILKNGSKIRGNVYLQHMPKYVLPCDIEIDGNLFLRDMNLLQFCGNFNVTGNIYVSPKSSFGAIPRNSKIGGRIIL